jgi:hypothetical protein
LCGEGAHGECASDSSLNEFPPAGFRGHYPAFYNVTGSFSPGTFAPSTRENRRANIPRTVFNRIGLTIIALLFVALFAALPMYLKMGRAIRAHRQHTVVKIEPARQRN